MRDGVVAGSFRDPSGFVFERSGQIYRQVNRRYQDSYDLLLSCGLYEALVSRGLIVHHEEVDLAPPDPAIAYRVLRPERIPFISYPYEWSFSQLRDAALLTLEVQEIALAHGMSLHDASAYNVQFRGAKPVLIDTLSFERIRKDEPWIAYGQFCRHFLAPLALMAYRDVRLGSLLRDHIDGIPLDLAALLLPLRARMKPSLLLHLHAHARHQAGTATTKRSSRSFSATAFQGLIESLRTAVKRLQPATSKTQWSSYYSEADHYSDETLRHKQALVEAAIDYVAPETVWDLGANTGRFARLAAKRDISAICFDSDHGSVEESYRRAVELDEHNITSLICDLTNPSPSLGWAHKERLSLIDRGPADLVLALALIHHLAIGNNVPLGDIACFLHLISRYLFIEFVPKTDPKVAVLLSVRDDIFEDYTIAGFENAFAHWFDQVETKELADSQRTLHLMRSRRPRGSEAVGF